MSQKLRINGQIAIVQANGGTASAFVPEIAVDFDPPADRLKKLLGRQAEAGQTAPRAVQ